MATSVLTVRYTALIFVIELELTPPVRSLNLPRQYRPIGMSREGLLLQSSTMYFVVFVQLTHFCNLVYYPKH
jgi:hypothetical protein